MEITAPGLEGVVVADTKLSLVDGELGRLVIAGHPIERLAGHVDVESVAHLLWHGRLPSPVEREHVAKRLADARVAAFDRIERLGDALDRANAMDALRASVAHLSIDSASPFPDTAYALTGAMAVYAAAWSRKRRSLDVVPPSREGDHATDLLRMLHGTGPSPARARALSAYLVTVADHGMNASTFAARVVVSTESDDVSAIVAAIGALKGRLHGGAPGPVLDMLDAIGAPDHAAKWIAERLERHERIMGMGHRIYRVRDPRAAVLEAATARLEREGGGGERLTLARAVEHEAERLLAIEKPERALRANVEFYTAVLLEAIGIPRDLFTATFAAGRVVGWCAHCEEQRANGRLIRPASRYVGPTPSQ